LGLGDGTVFDTNQTIFLVGSYTFTTVSDTADNICGCGSIPAAASARRTAVPVVDRHNGQRHPQRFNPPQIAALSSSSAATSGARRDDRRRAP
jgi:hypothetical protein